MPCKMIGDSLNPEWLANQRVLAMQDWIRALLMDRDADFPAWSIPSPEDFLSIKVFEGAPVRVKRVMRRAVKKLVKELADDPGCYWRQQPQRADNLLLLAGDICVSSDIGNMVRRMVVSADFVGSGPTAGGDLHSRLLQVMLTINAKEPLEFWITEANRNPAYYLGVAMMCARGSGLNPFLVMQRAPIETLMGMQDSITQVKDILTLGGYGESWVSAQLEEATPILGPDLSTFLRHSCVY